MRIRNLFVGCRGRIGWWDEDDEFVGGMKRTNLLGGVEDEFIGGG
jgi:hypothetical protein